MMRNNDMAISKGDNMKQIVTALAGLAFLASTPASAQQRQSPEDIANLSVKGFAQFQCAILASFGKVEGANADAHFKAGYANMHDFITFARANNDKAVGQAISAKTPMIVSMALGGPNVDFEIGRVYSEILQFVDDELRDRETWTHQKLDPKAPNVDPEVVIITAANKYREKNCSIISK